MKGTKEFPRITLDEWDAIAKDDDEIIPPEEIWDRVKEIERGEEIEEITIPVTPDEMREILKGRNKNGV